jgi:hypothetical protein
VINCCFNPACKQELLYLRDGSLYQWETGFGVTFHSEFFWLCPKCAVTSRLVRDNEGRPILASSFLAGRQTDRTSRIRRVLAGSGILRQRSEPQRITG